MGESKGDDPFPEEEIKTKDSRHRKAPVVTNVWLCVCVLAGGSWGRRRGISGWECNCVQYVLAATVNKETTVHRKMWLSYSWMKTT